MARLAESNDEEPGTLFKNINFFVLQRVPTRSTFVEAIKRNGGRVLPLERGAEIVIADHLRKDNPPGSISWKWIEQCIQEAKLLDTDQHPAAPKEAAVRRPGSLKPSKSTRNAFTEEDDVYLYHFARQRERMGAYMWGNQIYEQLENENPRHTLQSWRDRWKKFIKDTPPKRALDEEAAGIGNRPLVNGVTPPLNGPSRLRGQRLTQPPPQRPERAQRESNERVEESVRNTAPPSARSGSPAQRHNLNGRGADNDDVAQTPDNHSVRESSTRETPLAAPFQEHHITQEERDVLLWEGKEILGMHLSRQRQGWRHLARGMGKGTATQWKEYFESQIMPVAHAARRMSEARDLIPLSQQSGEDEAEELQSREEEVVDSREAARSEEGTDIKQEPDTESREPSTPQHIPRKSAMRGSSQGLSPSLARQLKRSKSPMVIVPSPHTSQKHVRFSNEPDNQDTPRRSRRLEHESPKQYVDIPSPYWRRKAQQHLEDASQQNNQEASQEFYTAQDAAMQELNGDEQENHNVEIIDLLDAHTDPGAQIEDFGNEYPHSAQEGAARRDFNIWQGSDPVEDEKENSRKRKSPSKSHDEPGLNFTERGMQFRLEPTVQSIDDIPFAEEDVETMTNAHSNELQRPQKRLCVQTDADDDDGQRDDDDDGKNDDDSLQTQIRVDDDSEMDEDRFNDDDGPILPSDSYDDAGKTLSQVQQIRHVDRARSDPPQSFTHKTRVEPQARENSERAASTTSASVNEERPGSAQHNDDVHGQSEDELSPREDDYNRHEVQNTVEGVNGVSESDEDDNDFSSSAAFQTDSEFEEDQRTALLANGYRDTQALLDDAESQGMDLMDMVLPPSSPPDAPPAGSQLLRTRLLEMSQESGLNRSQQSQQSARSPDAQQRTPTQREQHVSQSSQGSPLRTPTQTHRQLSGSSPHSRSRLLTTSHVSGQSEPSQRFEQSSTAGDRKGPDVTQQSQVQQASQSQSQQSHHAAALGSSQTQSQHSQPSQPSQTSQHSQHSQSHSLPNISQSRSQPKRAAQDTQALLVGDTPHPDLSLPAAQVSQASQQNGNPVPNSPHVQPQASQQTSPQATPTEINDFIDKLSSSLNISEDLIVWALTRTGFNSRLAQEALLCYLKTRKLPRKPGVWTEEDDRAALGSDARRIREVAVFHGDFFKSRLEQLHRFPELVGTKPPEE